MGIIAGLIGLVGAFLIFKLVKGSLKTGAKDGLIMAGLIAVVMLMGVFAIFTGTKPKEKPPRVAQKTEQPALESEKPVPQQLSPEELRAKHEAELEQSRRQAEETQRRMEEQVALEAERAAKRISVAEFETQFVGGFDAMAEMMGTVNLTDLSGAKHYPTSDGEVINYPLGNTGELKMKVIAKNGGVQGVSVQSSNFSREHLAAQVLTYNLVLQIVTPDADFETILRAINLDETFLQNLNRPQKITLNGYCYSKEPSNNNFTLSVAEQ